MTTHDEARLCLRLLRHGQVEHHKGDVGITSLGIGQAEAAGRWFAAESVEIACVLSGETRRTRDTADHFVAAYREAGGETADPVVSFALRNPDLYLGGHRINMGQGAAMLAEQSPLVSEHDVAQVDFYRGFLGADERVGYWLEHPNPPGESARSVGLRVDQCARSLADAPSLNGATIVGITHSPVLRAVRFHHWNEFSKEPPFLHGYDLVLNADRNLSLSTFTSNTGDIPATSRPGPGVVRPESDGSSEIATT